MLTESSIINFLVKIMSDNKKQKKSYVFAPKDFVLPDAMTH